MNSLRYRHYKRLIAKYNALRDIYCYNLSLIDICKADKNYRIVSIDSLIKYNLKLRRKMEKLMLKIRVMEADLR